MLSISPPAAGGDRGSPPEEQEPVLYLTHFSRPPFVSFGCVRPGSARSAVLLLRNPSAEPAVVTVDKLPQKRGFSVPETELLVPPYETLPLTITWTPLEEGGVRELLTFLLNDVVRHQAVLLGRAELPMKKKRSRWNTLKKKYSPLGSKASGLKNKVPCAKHGKNKTFIVPQNSGHGAVHRMRSPLQSCENLCTPMSAPSPVRESRRSSENRLPVGSVSPLSDQLQPFTPGSLRRSKTYSVLCTTEYSETIEEVTTTSTMHRDVLIEEEWTLSEQRVKKISMSPIPPGTMQHGNFICTPSIIHECTDYPPLSPTEFCKTEVTVKHSQTSSSFHESFHDLRRSQTPPPPVLGTPQRNILSPDSFVNNSYAVSDEYLTAAPHTPILSPDQFVKDNFLTPPVILDQFSLKTPTCNVLQEEGEVTEFLNEAIEDLEPPSSRLTFCVKKQKGSIGHLGDDRTVSRGCAKPLIITSTVTKVKAPSPLTDHTGSTVIPGHPRVIPSTITKVKALSPLTDNTGGAVNPGKQPVIPSTITKVKTWSPLTDNTGGAVNPGKPSVISAPVTKVRASSGKQATLHSPLNNNVTDIKNLVKLPIKSVKVEDDLKSQPNPLPINEESGVAYPVKPPIVSATVVKVRAADRMEVQQKPQLKSRRRLKNIESDESVDSQVVLPNLPVIVSDYASSISSSESSVNVSRPRSICGRKRRSEEISRDGSATSSDSVQSADNLAKKIQISKPSQHGSKQTPHSRSADLLMKNSRKSHKAKAETMKTKPALAKSHQKDNVGPPQLQSAVTFKTTKKIVAVAQSKLTFMKPPKTVIPRHPMPFAAKNMFYDERWMVKQERGFTWWLNFILTPDDFAVKTDSMKVNAAALILGAENSHKVSVPKAPTKEEVSLKAYTARCRLNKLRRSACCLFTSEPVVRAIRRLEVEIEARRLLVRKDRHLWKDIGERQKILNWLLSYNPLWLRVGLETIYGELISLESNSDVTGLAVFILNRLLWNPDIALEYRHPSVPHLYRDGHEEALSKFTLKKLLLLVFFLDYAKQSRLIDHDPCLFCKDAEFKASKDLLLAFSRDFLSGEGDLSRHLGYLGLAVCHVQTPLDEFDFAVTNLAVDLQCGIRLVRTMELLTQNWSLSKKLRVPAISRLQKMHNVEVAFQVLTGRGVQIKDERGVAITSKDIVDRHRERTLALLWHIVFSFQVDVLLNIDHLKEEIKFLRHAYSVQKKLAALRAFSAAARSKKRESDAFTPDNYSERVLLLMEWVNAVCAFYSAKVENFTVSFSDGRIFCYLLNHYHPGYVPSDAIRQRTTQTVECSKTGTIGLNSSSDSDNSLDMLAGVYDQGLASSSALFEELLENEKANFSLVQNAVCDLGGIPAMIHHSDMSNTIPDEKVVIIYLSFLCARLLDICKEARAARVIQAAWRRHRLAAEEQLLQKKHCAACVVQRAVRSFLSRRRVLRRTISALVIQKHWRRYQAYKELVKLRTLRRTEIESRAAIVIQKHWRSFATRKYYRSFKAHVVLMQAKVRAKIAVASYKRTIRAVKTIQDHVHSWLLAAKQRNQYLHLKAAAAVIQSAYRRWKCDKIKRENKAALVLQKAYRRWWERKLETKTNAAVAIQSWYRMLRERRKYLAMWVAAVKIQSLFKMNREQKRYIVLKQKVVFIQRLTRANNLMLKERESFRKQRTACVTIQSAVRGYLVRKRMKVWNNAATILQACYRMHKARQEYLAIYRAAVVLQRKLQAHNDRAHHRKTFLLIKQSAVRLQAAYRGYIERKRLRIQQAAAITIQARYQGYIARKQYLIMRQSALTIQSWYRGQKQKKKDMQNLLTAKKAIVVIQAAYRGFKARRRLRQQNSAAVVIQSAVRQWHALKKFREIKKATLTIQRRYRAVLTGRKERQQYLHLCLVVRKMQAIWRGRKARMEILKLHRAASLIQSNYRRHVCQTKYKTLKRSTEFIQRRYRAFLSQKCQRSHYLKTKVAITVLQSAYRGWKTRKNILHLHKAARAIQSCYRSYRVRKQYLKVRMGAVTIQRWYRTTMAAQRQRAEYVHLRRSIIKLQSIYRGLKTRQRIAQMKKAARSIQAVFRMHGQRVQYLRMKQAAVVIQQRYRAVLQRRKVQGQFLNLKKAACTIQAAWRGRRYRKEINRMHAAATLIQSIFRMYKQSVKSRKMRLAAVVIQQQYRALLQRRTVQGQYLNLKKAACIIQAAWRGRNVRKEISHMHVAATVIQSVFRMHKQSVKYQKTRQAAVIIQQRYRAVMQRRVQDQYMSLKKSACTIQAAWRGRSVRKEMSRMHAAATVIQSIFRMYKQSMKYCKMRQAAVMIQQQYRAVLQGRKVRDQYLNLKKAACIIQATWKGRSIRKEIGHMHSAATVIQAVFRMHKTCMEYRKLKCASITIQRRYRAYRCGVCTREAFLKLRESAIKLQSAYRGARVRWAITEMHQAASKIQASYRMYICQRNYERTQWAVRVMQQRYRAKKIRDFEVLRYSFIKDAAICIQAGCRGWHARKDLRNQRRAAVIIQRQLRMYIQRNWYCELKETTIQIQRLYRAAVATRQHYRKYQSMRKAASCIQAAYRGYKVRKELDRRHKMATSIQAYFRMHRDRVAYRVHRVAACKIQIWYRSAVECRQVRGRFLTLHSSAVTIQAGFKGMRVRRNIKAMNKAATVIQSSFRMYVHHIYYKSLMKATKTLQQRYREKKTRDRALHQYQSIRKSVVLLQAAFRGAKVRRQIKHMHHAAASIQRCMKAYLQRKKYIKLRSATICLQRLYRALVLGRSERVNYLKLRKSATCIQSAWRAYKARETWKRKKWAASMIQSSYRMYRQRKFYIALQQATRKIQSLFRANMLRNEAVEQFTRLRNATRCIQAAYWAMKERRESRRTAAAMVIQATFRMNRERKAFLQIKTAAVVIQAAYRAYAVRKRLKVMEATARCIQNWFRRCRQSRVQRLQYVSVRASAIVIQSAVRGMLARRIVRQEKAARKIQACLRMVVCRRRFLLLRKSAVTLQAAYRMHRMVTLYCKERTAAILLQQRYRALILMRQQRTVYLEHRRRVICLQSAIRRYSAQRRFRKARCAVVIIQAHWRRYIQRQIFFQYKQAALIIQQRYQARRLQMLHRHFYMRLRAAAIVLQAAYRASQTRALLRKERAACVIQRYYRSWTTRRDYATLTRTVQNLQRRVRTKQERARFIITRKAAMCIQRRWRETLVTRNIRKDFVQKREAARRLQSVYRGYVVRRDIHKMQSAACVIQAAFRGFRHRQSYLRVKAAAVTLQQRYRALQQGRREQLHYMHVRNSVIRLQACARGWLVRKQVALLIRKRQLLRFSSAVHHHLCAVRIQRFFRKYLILRKAQTQITHVVYIQRWYRSRVQQRNFHVKRQKIITVQRAVRTWLQRRHEAATKIQRNVRVFLQHRKRAKVMSGILKFQALWRGHQWRKKHDTKAVKKLRTSLRKVSEEIKEEDRLCNRTMVALHYLLTYKHLSYILAALQHLEVATRLSSVCCENMAQSGAIKTIFTLIRSCNRSIPCMEVIKLSIQVLLNLAKYEKTVFAVYEVENSVDVLLDLMQIYREKAGDKVSDKGGSIFTKACCLLAIFALNSQRAREIRAIPKAVDRICSIYKLTARKHKMDAARNIRQQLNSPQNFCNLSIQATPMRTRIVSRIKPDWVLRKDNMREVVDPLKAIQMVMVTFGVSV
ncbi:abnormal spindle-like microcephaly-associated protein [Dendropsophus ebraccatus]|uniref:abnormal spindle-like microcephaly-associated protein n=1 Tax=Dendropsophus ebraccatus TaxID=150705 RepID=UPI0038320949